MAIIKYCEFCKKTYDWERNSTSCPHRGFPQSKLCKNHSRLHCGNLECQTNLIKLPEKERNLG